MGWLLHCNTGSLRKHKPSLPCSILLSNNYVIIKTCIRNIKGQHQSRLQQKSQLKSFRQAFLSWPSFIPWQRKVCKMHILCNRTLFYPSSLNSCYSELNYLTTAYNISLCISLLSQSFPINNESYLVEVVSESLNS